MSVVRMAFSSVPHAGMKCPAITNTGSPYSRSAVHVDAYNWLFGRQVTVRTQPPDARCNLFNTCFSWNSKLPKRLLAEPRFAPCTPMLIWTDSTRSASLASLANFLSRAASTSRCTAIGCGRCGSSPASAEPADTNQRFRYLLEQGQTGLSTAFDLPTLMGLDSDNPRSAGEVGRLGVAVDTIDDMLALFDQIDLSRVSVSMTINAPADRHHGVLSGRRPRSWIRLARTPRHDSKRHPQGISRSE